MGTILIVSNVDCLEEHLKIAKEYDVAFEVNDFFDPGILEDEDQIRNIIAEYKRSGLPKGSTMHGAFYDIVPFSYDAGIRSASRKRMRQSMEIAAELGVGGVVFHTNVNSDLRSDVYDCRVVDEFEAIFKELLEDYPDMNIYLENMFDREPDLLQRIAQRLEKYDNFGICLDWAHANIYGSNMTDWVDRLKGWVKHIHINDNDLRRDLHDAVGSGLIDWRFFKQCYDRYFSECSLLIETSKPMMQIGSLEYLRQLSQKEVLMDERRSLKPEEMLEQIFHCMNRLASERDFDSAILILTELGRMLVNADRASFWYWDMKNKQYWTIAALDSGKIVIPEGTGIVGAAINLRETILLNDPYHDSRFNPQVDKETGYVTKSILCMPVYSASGEVIGAIQTINKIGDGGFNRDDERKLSLAATFSGKTLEAHMLRVQNQIDALTNLRNRKGFYDFFENVILPFGEENSASVVMCDIDFFKKVNDVYGHNAGDEVLCKVAGILEKYFKTCGEVFRWGGEEFIALQRTGVPEAAKVAETIRKEMEETVCRYEGIDIKITMSFGVSAIDVTRTLEENVNRADELLYEAKKTGRNKVVFKG